jgi:hypothetical protein
MSDRSIEKMLESIEKSVEKDFELLMTTGPEYFSTGELLEMRGRWKEQYSLFVQLHKLNLILGAGSPAWILLGFIFGALGWQLAATISLLLFPVTFIAFVTGTFLIRYRFKGKGYLDQIGRFINYELARRRDEMARRGL